MNEILICVIIILALFLALVILGAVLIAVVCRYCEIMRKLPLEREPRPVYTERKEGRFPEEQA